MEKKSRLINFIKALIIIVTAVAIVIGTSRILLLKSEDGINQFQAFYKQPENSIDVIFSGSSKVYCDISTGVLWDNYGIAAFDLGGAEAPSWVSYYQLKEALKTQRPKVICYEVSVAAMYSMLTQANNWASDNSYGMKWGKNRVDLIKENSEEEEFLSRLNPFNIMHGRYKDLDEDDFTNVRNSVVYKGFDPREAVIEMDTPTMDGVIETEPCTEKEDIYFRKIIELAKQEGIPILLFASPYGVTEKEQKILNYIGVLAEEEGVEFIDFNRKYDELDMNFSSDMADGGHLNYSGNYKFTKYFGSILKDKYEIPDHRGDTRYSSWEWDSALQNFERNDLIIEKSEDAVEILNLAQKGYIVFGVNGEKAYIIDDGNIVSEGDPGFRLTYTKGKDSFLFTEWDDKGNHLVSLFVNDDEYIEYYGNILFIYDTVNHKYIKSIYY